MPSGVNKYFFIFFYCDVKSVIQALRFQRGKAISVILKTGGGGTHQERWYVYV